MVVDVAGLYCVGDCNHLRVDGVECGISSQLSLVGYKNPAQDELAMEVSKFIAWISLLFLVKQLYLDDEGDNELR